MGRGRRSLDGDDLADLDEGSRSGRRRVAGLRVLAGRCGTGQRLDDGGCQERAVRPGEIGARTREIVLDEDGRAVVFDEEVVTLARIVAEKQRFGVRDLHGTAAVIRQL